MYEYDDCPLLDACSAAHGMSHAWHNKLLLPSVNSKFRIYQLGFGGKLCAATTPPHGGAGRSRPRITNALACHLGQAVHLGRPAGSLLSPIHKSLWKLSRKNALGAGAARPFGPARLHGRKRRYFPASTYARSLSVYLRRCSSCRPRPAAEKAASRTRGRRYTMIVRTSKTDHAGRTRNELSRPKMAR